MKIAIVDFLWGEPNGRMWNHERDLLEVLHERGIESNRTRRNCFCCSLRFLVVWGRLQRSERNSLLIAFGARARKAVECCRLTCFPCRENVVEMLPLWRTPTSRRVTERVLYAEQLGTDDDVVLIPPRFFRLLFRMRFVVVVGRIPTHISSTALWTVSNVESRQPKAHSSPAIS